MDRGYLEFDKKIPLGLYANIECLLQMRKAYGICHGHSEAQTDVDPTKFPLYSGEAQTVFHFASFDNKNLFLVQFQYTQWNAHSSSIPPNTMNSLSCLDNNYTLGD